MVEKKGRKILGTAIMFAWIGLRELLDAISRIDALKKIVGAAKDGGNMSIMDSLQNLPWYFPYITIPTGIFFLLYIWRMEAASILGREKLLPGWRFWARFLPRFLFSRRFELEGRQRVYLLIEMGREIRDKISHDPANERLEWVRKVNKTLEEYFPLKTPSFMSVHGDHWDDKGHRKILDDEIKWLERFLAS